MTGHSAKVELRLIVGDKSYSLSHVGAGLVQLRDWVKPVPATKAMIVIIVDENETRHSVWLPCGIPGAVEPIPYWDE